MDVPKLIFNFILCFSLLSCGGLSKNKLQDMLADNEIGLTKVANQFLGQNKIKNISISTDDKSICQMINMWRNCPGTSQSWEMWSDSLKTKIYLNSYFEVLRHENIELKDYNYYFQFLKNNKLWEIAKDPSECEECISLESGLNGLRYYKNTPNQMKTDNEYLSAKRLNGHWFEYTRDWN